MLNKEVKVILDLVRMKGKSLRPKQIVKFLLPIFIGLLTIIVGQSTVAPPANASIFGTVYNVAPKLSGGDKYGEVTCPAGQVVVGMTMGWNPISHNFTCKALNSDLTVSALTGKNANYVYCPDGKVAVGMAFINSNGIRAALLCKTSPELGDAEVETQYVSANNTPRAIDKPAGQAYFGGAAMRCNAGDIMVGYRVWSGAWLDGLAPRCAPFTKFTVTYNVNSGSGTAPATQQQSGPNASITLSSSYTGTRTGFQLSGWNTAADGLGTDYAAGATITPSANLTLYAKWTSTITYNGNTNSGGDVPDPTTAVSSAAITNLAPNSGNLVKTGFTFGGWNTAANGSGTTYLASNPNLVTETPYMHFDANDFNDTTNAWTDISGNTRSIPSTAVTNATTGSIRGNPTKVTNSAGSNGSSKSFPAVQGTTADGIVIGNGALTNYTFCHVARYSGATKDRIFAGTTGNWLSGFWSGATGVAYHEGWITASTGTNDTNWKIQCDTGGSKSSLRSNGVLKSSIANNATGLPANISINLQGSRSAPSGLSDWAVAEFIIYDSVLSDAKIQEVEERLNRKYGVGLHTSSIHTLNYASTGNITLYAQWNSTITYNGNGQTSASSTIPAATIAKGTAANTTLASAGTMARTGFSFAGWNTQADGLGTNYASGLTTYQSSGSVTLYAKWTATVTYDPNGASGLPSKSNDVFVNSITSIPTSNLATIGTMVRTGYTFAGWNLASNGSGTNYLDSGSVTIPSSYMQFKPSGYDSTTKKWAEANGKSSLEATIVCSDSSQCVTTQTVGVDGTNTNGSNKAISTIKGTTASKVTFENVAMNSYTFCHVTRYAGSAQQRIFTHPSVNWVSGFLTGYTGYYYGSGNAGSVAQGNGDTNWHLICDYNSNFRNNGNSGAASGRTSLPANIGIATWSNQQSDWEIAEILLFDSVLSLAQIEKIENQLRTTYGLTSYVVPSSVSYTPSGNVTLYAKWTANSYDVVYDISTSTSGSMANTTFTAGTAFPLRTATNAFARTGYTFKNWNTAANGSGTTYTNGQSITLFAGMTLYPQWNLIAPGAPTVAVSAGNTEVTVTPTPAAASGTTVGPTTSMLVTAFNSSGVALSPAKTCSVVLPATSCVITGLTNGTTYQFAATATNATSTSASSTKVNGTPAGVVVTYNASANGGIIGTSGTTGTSSATFNKGTALVLPTASKADSVFSGWYTAQSSGGVLVGAAGATYSPTTAITLYARFAGVVYTISYNGNGNTGGTVPVNGSYQAGSSSGYNNTQSYDYTGSDQTFNVPNNISGTQEVQVEVWGAGGAGTVYYYGLDYGGGAGGYTKATISTPTAGETLTIKVGKGGTVETTTSAYGGSGAGGNTSGRLGSSGGGYSGVFTGSTPLAISGGGGGASPGHSAGGLAGGGGGANQSGATSTDSTMSGRGGTTSAGGAKAASCATDGSQYTGGTACGGGAEGGGGGGAGYYGGGGGNSSGQANGGGGGGSGYLDATRGSLITATVGQNGAAPTTWAFPNKTSANYGSTNAGRGGKSVTNTTADNAGGNGRIVIQWKTGTGAYTILGTPSKVGHTFAGWNTKADGTGTDYAVSDSYSSNADLSLFAKWTAASRTVAYALDGGTSSATTTTLTGKVVGNTITLPASNTMSKTGYVFAGWSDGTTTYPGGATWTVPASDNNFTLTAQWITQTLSYSYDTNVGGTAPTGGTKTYGQTLVLAASTGLSKTGYTFGGWNDGSTTHLAGASITLNASKVYVAQWSAQSYSITYDGNSPSAGSVTSGSYVAGGVPYAIAANGFTKIGYTFAGWKDASNNSFTVGAGYSTAANLTLIAQWTASSYTISYNGNGSTGGSSPADGAFTTAVAFSVSANSGNLVKSGYTFAGWNTTAAGGGTTYAENASLTTTSNVTLYAKWTIISPLIAFNRGAATTTPAVFPTGTSAQYGSLFTLPTIDTSTVIADVTQIFTGWNDGTNTYAVGDTYRMGTANVTFTAQWVAVYTVRYVLNGGSGSVPADVLRTNNFTETLTSASATKTGFTLTGWKDQSGVSITTGANSWLITGTSYVAYAQWSPTLRTLSFDINGGSVAEASITGKVIGELVTLPTSSATKTGYVFTGWSNSGTTYPAGGTFTVGDGNAAFVAVWVGNLNTITYNGNGATGGTVPSNGNYISGDATAYTVSSNTEALVKSGFTFDGWYTTATGTGGTAYVAGTGTLTTTSNLTLFAKWSAASYTVSYASGDNSVTAPTQSSNMYGSSFTLPNALTRTGYTFLGWETGSGSTANLYAPGSSFTMGSSAITFTAKWSALSYVVVYSLNGGAGSTPLQANVEHNQSFTTPAAPSRAGFTFTGWSDGSTTTNATTLISNVSSNMTLTAQWTIAAPGIPGTPTAAPGNGSATITIAAPSTGGTPSSYTVTASPGGATCIVTAPGTSCTISPLTNGTAYTFTSTATNSAGNSTSGSTASASVTPAGIPGSPTGVTGTGVGGTANISWTLPASDGGSAITDYVVEYSVEGSGTWTTFADGVSTSTSATVTGLTAGNAYEFRVSTKNLIGTSLPSFTSPVVETLPTAPTITGTTPASGQVTVVWSAPTNLGSGTLTQYTITAYDANGNVAGTCNPDPGQTTCVVSGLDNGSPYTFKAAVTTTVGDSVQSSATSSVIPAGVPSAPADVTAVTSGSNMTITFTAPSDNGGAAITSYVITSSPSGATCTVGANATTYTCAGLTAGTNYSYTVKAVNNKGESSASLASTGVTAVAAPSAPQNVSAVITAGTTTLSATVSFEAPLNENGSPVTSYTVTASPGGATCTVNAPDLFCDIPVLPDQVYTFSVRATNAVGTSSASASSLEIKAINGIAPSLVSDPIPAPTGELMDTKVLSSNVDVTSFNSTPNSAITYQWKRCTDPADDTTCTSISGATSATYTLTSSDVDKYIRVAVTATNSIGAITKLSEATGVILATPVTPTTPSTPSTPSAPAPEPSPEVPSCNAACQAVKDAAATKAAADAAAKAAADKLAADAAAKLKADAAATTASTKANADAAAAAAAAKAAVEKAAAAEAAKIAAEAAATSAAVKAKAAADAQAAANKAAATAAVALKNSAASAAAKAAATASAQNAAASAAAAVKAAATAAQQAATAKNSAANANKQVDIAINSLNSKTAASQASAQANAIAAAAKAAANEAAAAAAAKASEAKAAATAAQKAAADTAARIATEQKEAATAAATAKAAADAAAKATAEKIAATNAAKTASENLLKVLEEKATLAEQAVKTSDENVRAEIAKKLEEIEVKAVEAEKIAEEATAEADDAVAEYEEAIEQATEASEVAETQAAEAVAVKAESVTKTAVATKAAAAATVAARVATAAKAAAAKVPSKAVIASKPSTSTKQNSATATVTGLKPGQKVKVTVNVRPKP